MKGFLITIGIIILIIILTVIISLAAAILFPVKEENARSADNTNATNNT